MKTTKHTGSTLAAVRKAALALPDVEESTSYGTPAFKVKRKLFARYRPDLDCLVLAMDVDDRDQAIAAEPDRYFLTDHYLNYPYVLLRLGHTKPAELTAILAAARAFLLRIKAPAKKSMR